MKRIRNIVILAAIASSTVVEANRLQVWTQENVSYGIGSGFTASISEENRYGISDLNGSKHIDEIHVAPSVDYAVVDWLSVGVNYRHVLIRNGSDSRYSQDRRPGVDLALRKKLSEASFLNRSRFICRSPEHEDPYFRYRNLSKVSYEIKPHVVPYVSFEWYYDEGSHDRPYRKNDRFSQQWLTFGIDWTSFGNWKFSTYYMLTENKDRTSHSWYPGHVVGFSISYIF